MNDRVPDKLAQRNQAMRIARDEILRRVAVWLSQQGFVRQGVGHFTRVANRLTCHVGFQKKSGGRDVRVSCHVERSCDPPHATTGPTNDAYGLLHSPNGKRYHFGWSTREADITRSAAEHCRFLEEVVLAWFDEQLADDRQPRLGPHS